jgi:hypothetical protein
MTIEVRRYLRMGPAIASLENLVGPDTIAAVGAVSPRSEIDVTIQSTSEITIEDARIGCDAAMAELTGAEFVEANPPAPSALSAVQSQAAKLTITGTVINVGSGWQDMTDGTNTLSVQISSRGGTRLLVVSSAIATVSIGGQVRTVISGGEFAANTELYEPISLPLLSAGTVAPCTTYVDLPPTENRTTYTVKLQAQGVGIIAAVTPRKGATLVVLEYALPPS